MLDNVGHFAHLSARDVTFAVVSDMPREQMEAFQAAHGMDDAHLLVARDELQRRLRGGRRRLRHQRLPA